MNLTPTFETVPGSDPHLAQCRPWCKRQNIAYHGISQTVPVTPGPFHFRAWLKLRDLTTDRGLAFRIFDPESPSLLDVHTPMLTGTLDWTPVELAFTVRPGTNLIQVEMFREPSWKFDNKFAGTAWVDAVELTGVR